MGKAIVFPKSGREIGLTLLPRNMWHWKIGRTKVRGIVETHRFCNMFQWSFYFGVFIYVWWTDN